MKQLFSYCVILDTYTTNEKGEKKYEDSKVIIDPKTVLAKSEKEVLFKVTREIPEQYSSDPDNVRILIKGF